MGSNCTTPKSKGITPSRKTKGTISPSSSTKSDDKFLSFSEQNKFLPSKVPSFETIANTENLEILSIRSKSMTTEVICEESPRLMTINSPATLNALTLPDFAEIKKPSQYKKGPSIGKGYYGEVYECLNLSSGELHAAKSVKVYGDIHRLQNYIDAFKKEIVVLQGLSHPNVVNYQTMQVSEFKEENYTIIDIISQHVSVGSIKALLDKFDKLDERVVSHYTKQMLEGLAYLHSNEIVHRNIKSSNILIDACGTAKLADFGSFKSLEKFVILNSPEKNNEKPYFTPKNKFCWQAPEVVMKKSQGKSSDIWSVGCVVLEMLTGTLPWKNANTTLEEVYKQIISGGLPPFPENISDNCRDFLTQVFTFRPEDRPTAFDLLDHPFIREQMASLTCLDYDSMQTFQMQQTLMGQNSIDDIFAGAKRNQESNQTKNHQDPSFGENACGRQIPKARTAELTIHVGQSKIIPNHLNKPATMLPTLVKLSSRTSIEDSSICRNSWEAAKTPGRRKEFDPELGGNNSVSTASKTTLSEETARFGTQTSIIQTPIKNTFFLSPSAVIHGDYQSTKRIEHSSSFAIQASLNKSRLAEKAVCDRNQNGSPATQKMFEEKMQEELDNLDADKENIKPSFQNGNRQTRTQKDLDQEKMEMRRRFEQEMAQELNGLEVSHFDR